MATNKILRYEKIFKILGNKRRLAILSVLQQYDGVSVGVIADKIGLSLHATSKHLLRLEQAGFVSSTEDGIFRIYKINRSNDRLIQAILKAL